MKHYQLKISYFVIISEKNNNENSKNSGNKKRSYAGREEYGRI